jgi:hypothetical protein
VCASMPTVEQPACERGLGHTEVLFRMDKDEWLAVCQAVCRTVSQATVWQLHLCVGRPGNELISDPCPSRSAAAALAGIWKSELTVKGWREYRV